MNTAVLTGRQVSAALKVLLVTQAGSIADVTLHTSCLSNDDSALKVSKLLKYFLDFLTKMYLYFHAQFKKENVLKKLIVWIKHKFPNPYIFSTFYHTPFIFQTMNSERSNSQSLKY